jgi:hypothetical protein
MLKRTIFLQFFLLATLIFVANICFGQHKIEATSTPLMVQAKVWSKDENKQVHYTGWKPFNTITLDSLKNFTITTQEQLDVYGGKKSVTVKATGFFKTEKINNRWWVIDPLGHPITITAVNSIRLGKSNNSEITQSKKFSNEQQWMSTTVNLIQDAGFNTAGCWSDTSNIIQFNASTKQPIAYTTQLNLLASYASLAKKNNSQRKGNTILSFILDTDFEIFCITETRKLSSQKNSPNLLGHFSDNELPFTHTQIAEILTITDQTNPCFVALKNWMTEQHVVDSTLTKKQKEEFIGWLAGKYYAIVSKAIKQNDPNHLYLGSRLHSSAKNNPFIFSAANGFIDIVSINYYGEWQPTSAHLSNWANWSTKPFFITEFYTKAEETGMSNQSGAGWIVASQSDRGKYYQNFCLPLLQAKNCVGWHWFRYQDNDPNDAAADKSNKDSNKGIVNSNYEAYIELLQMMKQLNANKYALINFFDN